MWVVSETIVSKGGIAAAAICAGLGVTAPGLANTPMTAGIVLEKMGVDERYAYVNGIVEGLAYARFRKDTVAAGANDEAGMKCIYAWFFAGDGSTYARIEATFRRYAEHLPSTLLAAMIKKECGE